MSHSVSLFYAATRIFPKCFNYCANSPFRLAIHSNGAMLLLVPGFVAVAADLEVDLTSVTLLNGSLVMVLGVRAYACPSFARCFGKGPVYLFTTLLVLVSCY
ncbi:hypothetical protein BJX64DRAFT_286147 [Aspergillus heterothallicus]